MITGGKPNSMFHHPNLIYNNVKKLRFTTIFLLYVIFLCATVSLTALIGRFFVVLSFHAIFT